MTAQRLHRLLSVVVCLFIVPHLLGHLAGLAGQDSFDRLQALLRPVYRNTVVEPLLLAALGVQTALGLRLAWRRWRKGARGLLPRLQFWSGLTLAVFVSQHLVALAALRWGAGLDSTYWWPASVASQWPLALYFWPYYFFGVWAFACHAGIGGYLALHRAAMPEAAQRVLWGAVLGGGLLSALILLGLSGLIHPVDLPDEWRAYVASLLPF